MNWWNILNEIIVVVGVPTIIKVLIDVGKKLKTLEVIESDLKDNIKPDLKDVRERFFSLEGKFSNTFANASPIALLPKGKEILEKSRLKDYIDQNKDKFIGQCCKKDQVLTQYEIQEIAFKFFDQLDFGEFETKIKEISFNNGMSVETIKRIGGIYFRDILLEKHHFKPEDLDKPKTS